jgi:MFS family permease
LVAPSLYFVESFPSLVLIFTILGTALGSAVVVIVSVIPQWFDDSRGLATGFLFVGIGLSLLVMPPAWNIALSAIGVRDGFLVMIGLTACSFLVAGLVTKHPPWGPETTVTFRALRTWIEQLTRTRQFYYLFVGFGLAFTWFFLLAGFGVSLFESRGLDSASASLAFGLIGGISIASRLGSGAIADTIGYGRTMSVSLLFASIGCLVLFLPGVVTIYVGIILFGVSLGGVTTLYIPILLQIYDPDKSTAVVGIFTGGVGFPALLAPPIATILVSETASFIPIVVLTLGTVLAAVVLIWLGRISST